MAQAEENPTTSKAAPAAGSAIPVEVVRQAAGIDRSALAAKTRVYNLAKELGASSRDVLGWLESVGLTKKTQSTLTVEEVGTLLDALAPKPEPKAEAAPEPEAEAAPEVDEEAKLRHRVQKSVENEIHQIEEKVEAELAGETQKKAAPKKAAKKTTQKAAPKKAAKKAAPKKAAKKAPAKATAAPGAEDAAKLRHQVQKSVENEIHQIEEKVEAELADAAKLRHQVQKGIENEIHQIEEKVEAELQERVAEEAVAAEIPAIPETSEAAETPAPVESEQEADAPLFVAPHAESDESDESDEFDEADELDEDQADETDEDDDEATVSTSRRRRGRRGARRGRGAPGAEVEVVEPTADEDEEAEEETDEEEQAASVSDEPVALRGSTRLEAQRRRRNERREEERNKRHIISEAEFLARRESVERTMIVRERERTDHPGKVTQVGVLEDELLVEHFVTSDTQTTMIGNIYLGRVQNVLPSMEAAFIDIGKGRNGVLYAGEVDWKAAGLGGRGRRIEQALRSGDQVIVQVTKDPIGHKGARLTTQISFAGRYLVYVPGGHSAGISRKLPAPERKRLKDILKRVVPRHGGAIIRTAAEGASEAAIAADVSRLHAQWEDIQVRAQDEMDSRGAKPVTLYEEPDMLVKVVRDLFNEDFTSLVVDGERAWKTVKAYVHSVAPDLEDRLVRFNREENGGRDAFTAHRVDEQLHKALSRMVWLPSGGSLVIDRTEAMTVIDVNTGKFTGSGGNLEQTVTKNNLEAAEEIVRQLRLRDVGGMIVIDFIDMVLPENQELVLRRLKEALGRDRTRHQVSEVTSLGLVQLTRKRLGTGLLETFSTPCECCDGRGIILHEDPVEQGESAQRYALADKDRQDKRRRHDEGLAAIAALAASVVKPDEGSEGAEGADGEAEAKTEAKTEAEDSKRAPRKPRGNRRRQQRRNAEPAEDREVSGVGEASSVSAVSELEKIVSAAVDKADTDDPDEPSGADYERAVAEFEASPRRRRATRGNSRSDHRPRREDFEPAAPERRAPEEPEADVPAASPVAEHAEAVRGSRESAFLRRHRRAVRRGVSGKRGRGGVEKPHTETEVQPAPEPQPESRPESVASPRGRHRRRATRRSGGATS